MKQVDIPAFWQNLQKPARPLNQSCVDEINKILNFYNDNDYDLSLGGLASYLGQVDTESNHTFAPIREMGGRHYINYLIGKLGIRTSQEAWMFRGWGRIQTTGRTGFATAVDIINKYIGANGDQFSNALDFGNWLLEDHPKDLEDKFDLMVGFECVSKGLYTGRKMNDYILADGTFDFFNARKVVNPNEIHSRPQTVHNIANVSEAFFDALKFKEA